jgi:hypothetical protein
MIGTSISSMKIGHCSIFLLRNKYTALSSTATNFCFPIMLKHAEGVVSRSPNSRFSRFLNALSLAKSVPMPIGVHDKIFSFNAGRIHFRYSPSETFILKCLASSSKVLHWKYLCIVLITCMSNWLVLKKELQEAAFESLYLLMRRKIRGAILLLLYLTRSVASISGWEWSV